MQLPDKYADIFYNAIDTYGYVEDQIDKKLNRLKERIRADGKPKEEESGHE